PCAKLDDIRSVLVVPVCGAENQLIGALALRVMKQRRDWQTANVSVVKVVAEVIGKAIQAARVQEVIREQANLLDLATDAIVVRDMEGRILFWNRGAEKHYGWPREEVLGKQILEGIYKDPQ